jgi:hypothetical protein
MQSIYKCTASGHLNTWGYYVHHDSVCVHARMPPLWGYLHEQATLDATLVPVR